MQTRIILSALLVAQLADAASFTIGVALHGIGLESNGVAVTLYRSAGLGGVLLVKGAVLLLTLGLLVANATRFPRLLVWGAAAATSLGVLGLLTNVVSLALLAG